MERIQPGCGRLAGKVSLQHKNFIRTLADDLFALRTQRLWANQHLPPVNHTRGQQGGHAVKVRCTPTRFRARVAISRAGNSRCNLADRAAEPFLRYGYAIPVMAVQGERVSMRPRNPKPTVGLST